MIVLWRRGRSQGAKRLFEKLKSMNVDIKLVRNEFISKYLNNASTCINWGNTITLPPNNLKIINKPEDIQPNKLKFFETIPVIKTVTWTTRLDVVKSWIRSGYTVYQRTNLVGSGGRGIKVAKAIEDLIYAPLYTKGINGDEYRVHVFMGNIIDFRKKAKMTTETLLERGITFNAEIKNHDNGWVFKKNDIVLPDKVAKLALDTYNNVPLDFFAADIIFDGKDAYLLEINSKPGIIKSTVDAYANAITNMEGIW